MVFQSKTGVDVEKTVQNSQFKIAANSKIFSVLSDSIYVYKIDAVIRELCCNAYDAHVEAGQDKPFVVKLPSDFDPEFKVRDFGYGLSHEDMFMYTTYGESTKSSSNVYIGAFGIGAKSPFAYTNTFNVTSYQGGKGRAYSMFIEEGAPQMTLLGEFETDEPSGLEVFFPVKISDVRNFQDKAVQILAFMADKLEVKGVSDRWHEDFAIEVKKYEWVDAPYIGQGYRTSRIVLDTNCSGLHILQGNVVYKMASYDVREILKYAIGNDYDKIVRYLKSDFYLSGFIKVPNGTFMPHPSRERLTFDDLTKTSLKNIFSKVFKHFVYDDVNTFLENVKTYYELYFVLLMKSPIIRSLPMIADFVIEEQNKAINSNSVAKPVRNFDDWRKTEFLGIIADSHAGGYRFKQAGHLTMTGSFASRIYFTNKYPLNTDYRYRLINDMRKREINRAIILDDRRSRNMFLASDKALFIDVRSLPELTQTEWSEFKKVAQSTATGVRVKKEEVSFVTMDKRYMGARLQQLAADKIADLASKMSIMWVGSNRRYEFPAGGCTYNLKQTGHCREIYRNLAFYFNTAKDMIPNWKEGDNIRFGIAVLPEGHFLREVLPELAKGLRSAALFEIREFLKVPRFEIEDYAGDVLIEYFIKDPVMFGRLLEGWDKREAFDKWMASGFPKGTAIIHKPYIPFFLWRVLDTEMEEARLLYDAMNNCVKIRMKDFYSYVSRKFPLFRRCLWVAVSDNEVAGELIEYTKFKLGIKSNE
jgi:hypothetical protein